MTFWYICAINIYTNIDKCWHGYVREVVKIVNDRKIKQIDNIRVDASIKNDMDFVSWKVELNRELASFWESITEETKE